MIAMRWRIWAAVPIFAATAAVGAQPQRVPNLNVKSTCHSSGSMQDQAADACMKDELGAKDELSKMWSRIPTQIRQTCIDEVKIGGSPSYVELLTCAQMNEWSKIPPSTTPSAAAGAKLR